MWLECTHRSAAKSSRLVTEMCPCGGRDGMVGVRDASDRGRGGAREMHAINRGSFMAEVRRAPFEPSARFWRTLGPSSKNSLKPRRPWRQHGTAPVRRPGAGCGSDRERYRLRLAVVAMKVVHPEQAWKTGGCPPSAPKPEPRMNLHKNARTKPHSRLLMVRRVLEEKQPAIKVAADFGVSERTVRKWLARWRAGGEPALNDRSSAPAPQRRRPPEQVAAIEALRRQRLTSPVIARRLGLPLSTVGGILRRRGLGRLKRLDPPAPVVRYQRERPGELVHIDTKKLGKIAGIGHRITGRRSGMVNRHRGIGWEYPHGAVDDAARLAYTEILPDERKASASAFLERAL